MNKKLIIVGAGEFAEIAYEYFTHDSAYEVVGFAVEQAYLEKTSLYDLPVIPFENMEAQFPPAECDAFVAITYTKLNTVRARLCQLTRAKGYRLTNYISSRAFVWHNVKLGENCFIFENNVLQHHVEVGDNVIMWSGNHIGHRSTIADNVFISSHCVISGYCHIGENCFIGVNTTFADHVVVGGFAFFAAASLVLKNVAGDQVYSGSPVKAAKVSAKRFLKVR